MFETFGDEWCYETICRLLGRHFGLCFISNLLLPNNNNILLLPLMPLCGQGNNSNNNNNNNNNVKKDLLLFQFLTSRPLTKNWNVHFCPTMWIITLNPDPDSATFYANVTRLRRPLQNYVASTNRIVTAILKRSISAKLALALVLGWRNIVVMFPPTNPMRISPVFQNTHAIARRVPSIGMNPKFSRLLTTRAKKLFSRTASFVKTSRFVAIRLQLGKV